METMLNIHEAKAGFSSLLAAVENEMITVTIMRYGKPIAKLMPIVRRRSTKPMRKYVGKVKIVGDVFGDTTGDWEAANGSSPS